jgi:hypothetical protein
MRVEFDFSAFGKTRWYEYAARFFFGGAITVVAGVLAKQYGPVFGGLFLAFPAIFPAAATLLDKHTRERRLRAGIPHTIRGRLAAALDARGAALGSIALAVFALFVWKFLPRWGGALSVLAALSLWLGLSVLIWLAYKLRHHLA